MSVRGLRIPLPLRTDSYKASHFLGYKPGIKRIFAYMEARDRARYPETPFFGLQASLMEHFSEPVTLDDVRRAESFWAGHGEPFDVEGWKHIVYKYGGRLPLRICAVREGTVVPKGNVLMTVESTDERVPWVVGHVETILERDVWYGSTVAALGRACKKVILRHLSETGAGDPKKEIDFKLHDFGARGGSSTETVERGAMAHLVNFKGTDSVEGILAAQHYYDTDEMLGFSIPALEHSTVMSWRRAGHSEEECFRHFLLECKARGFRMVACVSDTYDYANCVKNIWFGSMLQFVKDLGMKVIIRPDSGDAVENNALPVDTAFEVEGGGGWVNQKGYKMLPSFYGTIQGDGNKDESDIDATLIGLAKRKVSASNLAFGMGGGLLQLPNRDTQFFAYKPSEMEDEQGAFDTVKDPKTDPGKRSKGGRLGLFRENGTLVTKVVDINGFGRDQRELPVDNQLKLVWDTTLINRTVFPEVRARAAVGL
jgi:nicotinamide phosphoribosyltransferase